MPIKHTLWQVGGGTKLWFQQWGELPYRTAREAENRAQTERFLGPSPPPVTQLRYESLPPPPPPSAVVDDSSPVPIRLLALLPGSGFDPIRCTLTTSDTNASYEALSYCWGDATHCPLITCNSAEMQVTRNLKVALSDLRRADRVRVLWVDAVCINQTDIAERESQVSQMGHIYRRATRTVVHLGEPSAHNELAFDALTVMAGLYDQVQDGGWEADQVLERYRETAGARLGAELGVLGDDALEELAKKQWFTRMWVLQEVALGRDVTLTCGAREAQWEIFARGLSMKIMLDVLLENPTNSARSNAGVLRFIALRELVRTRADSLSLLMLLNHVRSLDATDKRDKVYAVFGLTGDLARLGISVDYTIELARLYTDMAVAIIGDSNNLDILSIPRMDSDVSRKMPSWVPDWSERFGFPRSFLERGNTGAADDDDGNAKLFCASARTKHYTSSDSRTSTSLIISGFVFDRLDRLCRPFPTSTTTDTSLGQYKQSLHDPAKRMSFSAFTGFPKALAAQAKDAVKLGGVQVEWLWFLFRNGVAPAFSSADSPIYGPTGEHGSQAAARTICADTMPDALVGRPDALQLCFASAFYTTGTWNQLRRLGMRLPRVVADETATMDLVEMAIGRRLVLTERGYLGLAPAAAREGDVVVLAQGGRLPLVLRAVDGDAGAWALVGDCYVHGIMHGEAFDPGKCVEMRLV